MSNHIKPVNMLVEPINDDDFLQQFGSQSLEPVHFNHLGHLRLAWLYLKRFGLEQAIAKVSKGIVLYATSLGAADKYHATITEALMRIMAKRMQQSNFGNWQDFLQQNQDLVEDALSLLTRNYSKGLLFSEAAKSEFMEPDIRSF